MINLSLMEFSLEHYGWHFAIGRVVYKDHHGHLFFIAKEDGEWEIDLFWFRRWFI